VDTTTTRPAHSLEAERTTLGALLLDPERMIDIAPVLTIGDFYDPVYGAIYAALLDLHDQRRPIDFVTVCDVLRSNPKVEQVGGAGFLAELVSDVPTASHVKQYADIVREKSLRRKLAGVGNRLAKLATQGEADAAALLEETEKELLALSRTTAQDQQLSRLVDIAESRYDHYLQVYEADDPQRFFGIRTGFTELDRLLTGLAPGHLMIIAGRPSMGKTALALDIARNVARDQAKTVAIFSLEMTKEQLADRLFAGMLGIDTVKLHRGELTDDEFQAMGAVMDQLQNQRLFVYDDPDTTLSHLRSLARKQQREYGLDLLIVDYLTLIEVTDRSAGENQVQRISYISKSLKNLARELACPVIVLSQLSRSCEQRTPPIPILSDLRDSGAIEQDADSVVMLYRQGYYHEDCDQPDLTDLYLRKNRQGPTGRIELLFERGTMAFRPH